MKKFVTLSAVALAGATLGVGSTFGWWAEDAPVPKENVQPADSPAPVPSLTESAPTLAPLEVPIAPVLGRIEISGPDEVRGDRPTPSFGDFGVMSQFSPAYVPGSTSGISRDDADRLTKELIKEAEELEKKGQKEAVEIHRKLISRLQRTPRRHLPGAQPLTLTPAMRDFLPTYPPGTGPSSAGVVSQTPRVEYRMATKLDDFAIGLAQRAGTLEAEAERLEEQGQRTLADEKRKLALQLKDLEKKFPPVNLPVPVTRAGQHIPTPARAPDSRSEFTIPPHAMMLKLRAMNMASEAVVAERLAEELDEEATQLDQLGEKQAAEKKRQVAKAVRRGAKEMGQRATWIKPAAPTDAAVTPTSPIADMVSAPKVKFVPLDARAESKILELAKDIEQEADRLEKEGKKEAAEAKRSAVRRIRETLPKVEFGVGKEWVTIEAVAEKNPVASAISELDKELLNLKEAVAKTDDPEARQQLMAKAYALGLKRQLLQSNVPHLEIREIGEKERLQAAIRGLKEEIQNMRSNVNRAELDVASDDSQPESKLKDKSRDPGEEATGKASKKIDKSLPMKLRGYAQQLRAQGHRDQAQALLDQANELEHRSLPSVTRSELFPKEPLWNKEEARKESRPPSERKSEVRNGDRILIEKELRVHGPVKLDGLQEKLAKLFPESTIDLFFITPEALRIRLKARDEDEASRILKISAAEIMIQQGNRDLAEADKPEQKRIPVGAHQSEVQELLRALHHEITELRSEVRDLRSVIKEESRNEKRGAKASDIPRPTDHMPIDVKHNSGIRTPAPVKHIQYTENHPEFSKESEQKDKPSDDQKATDAIDESKKPAASVEDKPQIDD